MVILIQGASDIGRLALADLILKKHKKFRHLTLEQLGGILSQFGMDMSDDGEFLLQLAFQCAEEMRESGHHLVLSLPPLEDLDAFRDEVGDDALVVHFADEEFPEEENADIVIDSSSQSVNDAYKMVAKHIVKA